MLDPLHECASTTTRNKACELLEMKPRRLAFVHVGFAGRMRSARVATLCAALAMGVGLLQGCSTASPTSFMTPKAEHGQREAFRRGTTYLFSQTPRTFVAVSVSPEHFDDDSPPLLLVTVANLGRYPIDISRSDFTMTAGDTPIKLRSKAEIVEASASRESWRRTMLALAGALESLGKSGAEEVMVTDRAADRISRVSEDESGFRREMNVLLLEKETIYPGRDATFALAPDLPPINGPVAYQLTAQIGLDVHKITFTRSRRPD